MENGVNCVDGNNFSAGENWKAAEDVWDGMVFSISSSFTELKKIRK